MSQEPTTGSLPPTTSTQSALILGATGQTGRHLLKELLASPHFSRVGEYGRRVTPKDQLAAGVDKLVQKEIDFENLQKSDLGETVWDVVYITLGTTKANAGSAEAFEKIDREYVINAAKEARKANPNASQRIVYLSSTGADAKSYFLYPRSKGLTEQGLASLGYSDIIVFRPGLLAQTNRSDNRLLENITAKFTGILSHLSDSVEIPVSTLGKAMYFAGKLGSANLPATADAVSVKVQDSAIPMTVIKNAGAIKLAKLASESAKE